MQEGLYMYVTFSWFANSRTAVTSAVVTFLLIQTPDEKKEEAKLKSLPKGIGFGRVIH